MFFVIIFDIILGMNKFFLIPRLLCCFILIHTVVYGLEKSSPCEGDIYIPDSCGIIKDSFVADNPESTVIYIQDSHTSVSAQKNLVRIIRLLKDQYGVRSIYVEGASGVIDCSELSIFPDTKVKKLVSSYYLKKGYIDGSEYLSITENSDENNLIRIYGVEDRELYLKNMRAFLGSQKYGERISGFVKGIQTYIDSLKERIYSDELCLFDKATRSFHNNKQGFIEYCRTVAMGATNSSVGYEDLKDFSMFIKLNNLEKKINFNRADTERQLAIHTLSALLTKSEADDLLKKEFNFKTNSISLSEYIPFFNKLSERYKFDLDRFPEFEKFMDYVLLYLDIDRDKVLSEAFALEDRIFSVLMTKPDQRKLHRVSKILDILSRFEKLQLSKPLFNRYKQYVALFPFKQIDAFLAEKGDQYKMPYLPDVDFSSIVSSVKSFEEFYTVAQLREKAMVENMIGALNKSTENRVVLIAGGFHKNGISDLLRENNLSYIVVTPSSDDKSELIPYLSLLNDFKTPLDRLIGANTSTLKVASWLAIDPLIQGNRKTVMLKKIKTLLSATKLYSLYTENLKKYPLLSTDNSLRHQVESSLKNSINKIISQAGYDNLLTVSNVEITEDGLSANINLMESGQVTQEVISVRYGDNVTDQNKKITDHLLEYIKLDTGINEEFIDSYASRIFKGERFLKTAIILRELLKSDHDFSSLAKTIVEEEPDTEISPDGQRLILSELSDAGVVKSQGGVYSLSTDNSIRFSVLLLTSLLSSDRTDFLSTGTAVVDIAELPTGVRDLNPSFCSKISTFMLDTSISLPLFIESMQSMYERFANNSDTPVKLSSETNGVKISLISISPNDDRSLLHISKISFGHIPVATETTAITLSQPIAFDDSLPSDTDQNEKELFLMAQLGDRDAEEALCIRYLKLALFIAKKRYKRSVASTFHKGLDLSDFISCASLGLLKAVRNYDPYVGVKFSTFSYKVISNEITRTLSSNSNLSLWYDKNVKIVLRSISSYKKEFGVSPSLKELSGYIFKSEGISIGEKRIKELLAMSKTTDQSSFQSSSFADDDKGHFAPENTVASQDRRAMVYEQLEKNSEQEFVRYIISFLEPIDRDIIISHELDENLTMEELGKRYNLTKQRIEQRRVVALKKMKLLIEMVNLIGRKKMDEFGQVVLSQVRSIPLRQQVIMRLIYLDGLTRKELSAFFNNMSKSAPQIMDTSFINFLKDKIDVYSDSHIKSFLKENKSFWNVFFRRFEEKDYEEIGTFLINLFKDKADLNISDIALKTIIDGNDLSAFEKEVIVLRYSQNHDLKTIADVFYVPVEKIESTLSDITDRLLGQVRSKYSGYLRQQAKLSDLLSVAFDEIPKQEMLFDSIAFFDYFNSDLLNGKISGRQKKEAVQNAISFLPKTEQLVVKFVLAGRYDLLLDKAKQIGMSENTIRSQVLDFLKQVGSVIEFSYLAKDENIKQVGAIVFEEFNKLPVRDQIVLRLLIIDGATFEEIKDRFNIASDKKVNKLISDVRRKFLANVRKNMEADVFLWRFRNFETISLDMFLRSVLTDYAQGIAEVLEKIVTDELKLDVSPENLKSIAEDYNSFLDKQEQEILRLRYVDGLKVDEIGLVINVHRQSVSHRLRAIRDKIKSVFVVRANMMPETRSSFTEILLKELNDSTLRERKFYLGLLHNGFLSKDVETKYGVFKEAVSRVRKRVTSRLYGLLGDNMEIVSLQKEYGLSFEQIIMGLIHDIPNNKFLEEEKIPQDLVSVVTQILPDTISSEYSDKQLRQISQDALLFLDSQTKEYLKLRYIDKMTSKEIAQLKGKTKYAVDRIFSDKINLFLRVFCDVYKKIGTDNLSRVRLLLAESMMDLDIADRHALVLYAYDDIDYEKAEELINKKITQPKARTKYLRRLKDLQSRFLSRLTSSQVKDIFAGKTISLEYFLKGLKHQVPRSYFKIPDSVATESDLIYPSEKYNDQFLRNVYSKIGYTNEPTQFLLAEMAAILDSLKGVKLEIIEMAFNRNMSTKRISEELEIDLKTAKSRLRSSVDAVKRAHKLYQVFTPKERSYLRSKLSDTLKSLNFWQRAIIVYRYFDDLSLKETEDLLGLNKNDLITNALKTISRRYVKNLDDKDLRKKFEKNNVKNRLLGYFLYSLRAQYARGQFLIPELDKDLLIGQINSVRDLREKYPRGELLALYMKLNETFNSLASYEKNILYLYYFQKFSIDQLQQFFGDTITTDRIEEITKKLRGLFLEKLRSAKIKSLFENNFDEFKIFFKRLNNNIPFEFYTVSSELFESNTPSKAMTSQPETVYTHKSVNKLFYEFGSADTSSMKDFLNGYRSYKSVLPDPIVLDKNSLFKKWRNSPNLRSMQEESGLTMRETVLLRTILIKTGYFPSAPSDLDIFVLDIDSFGFSQDLPSYNIFLRNEFINKIRFLQQAYKLNNRSFRIVFFSRSFDLNQIESFFGSYLFNALRNGNHNFYDKEIFSKFKFVDQENINFLSSLEGDYGVSNVNLKVFSNSPSIIDTALLFGAVCSDRSGNVFDALDVFAVIHPNASADLPICGSDLSLQDIVDRGRKTYYAVSGCEFSIAKPIQENISKYSLIDRSL